jgi:hypothetical protein
MTRKDYVMIAEVINRNTGSLTESAFIDFARMAEDLATELQNDNPRFDRDRFLTACGVK